MSNESQIDSLQTFIDQIKAICDEENEFVYRGQRSETWNIESSAYYDLKTQKGLPPTVMDLHDYHKYLLHEARKLSDCKKDQSAIELMAHLQHIGTHTMLLDFTKNPLVALWFACQPVKPADKDISKNGVVYCLKSNSITHSMPELLAEKSNEIFDLLQKENTDNSTILRHRSRRYQYVPKHLNQRIISQQSIFVVPLQGQIEKNLFVSMFIPHEKKETILKDLKILGISEEILFPDLQGMTSWYSCAEMDMKNFQRDVIYAERLLIDEEDEKALLEYENIFNRYKDVIDTELNAEEKAVLYQDAGVVYYFNKNYQQAQEYLEQAKEIWEKPCIDSANSSNECYMSLGAVYTEQEKYNEALASYEKALKIQEEVPSIDPVFIASTHQNFGLVYTKQRNYKEACASYEKALKIQEEVLGRTHPNTIQTYKNLAISNARCGNENEANVYNEIALKN